MIFEYTRIHEIFVPPEGQKAVPLAGQKINMEIAEFS